MAMYVGLMTAMAAFVGGLAIVAKTLLWGDQVAGWPTMMVVILLWAACS